MEIEDLDWSDEAEAKFAVHGVSPTEVRRLVRSGRYVINEHRDFPDQVRLTGLTASGRLLTIILEETSVATLWRPITGWDATRIEEEYYWTEFR